MTNLDWLQKIEKLGRSLVLPLVQMFMCNQLNEFFSNIKSMKSIIHKDTERVPLIYKFTT